MRSKYLHLNYILFYSILILLLIKLSASYLGVGLGWWLRHLTPNVDKFNPLGLPANTQGYVDYLMFPLQLLYLFINFKKLGSLLLPFLITLVMYFINLGTFLYTGFEFIDSIQYTLKIAAPIYLFMMLIIHHKIYGFSIKNMMIVFVSYCFFLAIIALLLFDVSFNRDAERLPIYFSGLHTHCYVLAVTFIAVAFLIKKNHWLLYSWMFVSLAFLVLGYNVRTTVVFYFLFIAVTLYQSNDFFKHAFAKVFIYVPFVLLASLVFLRNIDFDSFSSGRLTMYAAKFDILKDYNVVDFMFGRGKGSDYITTSQWWWAKKGSHNDFLTFLVENGLPYVLLFIGLIGSVLAFRKRVSLYSIVLIVGYLMTSALSNGFAVRPLASYLFFMVLALTYIQLEKKQQTWALEK